MSKRVCCKKDTKLKTVNEVNETGFSVTLRIRGADQLPRAKYLTVREADRRLHAVGK